MPKKPKPTKAPAPPRRRFGALRDLFAPAGVALSIGQISAKLKTQDHSTRAAISKLGKAEKDPVHIVRDRETGLYAVQKPAAA